MAETAINSEPKSEIVCISAADIRIKPIRWLWPDFLPLGKLTLLAGPAGLGKTTLAFDIAARITTGADWPDGSKGTQPRDVYIWSAEDDLDDVIVPRLMGANADLKRIRFPDKAVVGGKRVPFDPSQHIEKLHRDLRNNQSDVGLIIFDPILGLIHGDMNQANHVRSSLQPLIDLGRALNITALGLSHPGKPSAANPRSVVDSVIGSQAFTALPRMVWAANWSQQHDSRVLAKAKQNITTSGGIKYALAPTTIIDPKTGQRLNPVGIMWGRAVKGSADEIFGADADTQKEKDEPKPAVAFLLRELPGGQPRLATELEKLAQAEGISKTQLSYAKRKLGISDGKLDGKHSSWFMSTAEAEQCTATPS